MNKRNIILPIIFFILLSGTQFKCSDNIPVNTDSLITANKKFAFDLYHKINNKKGNLFFSPFSISSALAMTYEGARSETQKQMAKVLNFPENASDINKAYKLFNDSLAMLKDDKTYFEVANAIWADINWKFLDSYFNLTKEYYGATVENIDMKNGEKSAKIINKWTKDKTNGKIDKIVNKNDFANARMVLANAIYFTGIWKYKFDEKQTSVKKFTLSDKTKIDADFMYISNKFNIYKDETVEVLELPYENSKLSMLIILPSEKTNIYDFEENFNFENYNKWLGKLKSVNIDVLLPKFTMKYEIGLKKALSDMGMPIAFSLSADFSGMTGRQDLMIDKVLHKSFVEVNEEGTEASAATVVIMREKSAAIKNVFRADRPFIFIIKDNMSNTILFTGRIEKPVFK